MSEKRNRKTAYLRYLPIIILVFCGLLGIGYLIYRQTTISVSGDFLFTAKLYLEKNELRGANSNLEVVEILESRVIDRSNAFIALANSGDCIKLQLTELELEANLDALLLKILTLQSNDLRAGKFSSLETIMGVVGGIESECEFHSDYGLLQKVFSAISIGLEPLLAPDLDTQATASNEGFNLLNDRVSQTEFTEQEILNNVSGLLLIAKKNLENIDSDLSGLEAYIALETNELIYDNLTQILDEGSEVNISFEGVTKTLCKLMSDHPKCSEDVLVSTWNSINGLATPADRIKSGTRIFTDYLNLLINELEIE